MAFDAVVLPEKAIVLDWVFANAPPRNASVYDNNNNKDFRALVSKVIPDEETWILEQERIYIKLQEQRRLKEAALAAKVIYKEYIKFHIFKLIVSHLSGSCLQDEKTAIIKAKTKEKTLQRFLHSRKHIVFTEPLRVQAGSAITVFYNPCNTILKGKPEVWFTHSFNRWTHRNGSFPPQKMLSSKIETYLKTSGESFI